MSRGVHDPYLQHFEAGSAGRWGGDEARERGFPEDSYPRRALLWVPERPAAWF